jgi:hypothetical protein
MSAAAAAPGPANSRAGREAPAGQGVAAGAWRWSVLAPVEGTRAARPSWYHPVRWDGNVDITAVLLQAAISGVLSGSVVAALLGLVFRKRTERITAEVRQRFDYEMLRHRSQTDWQDQVLSKLLGPMVMQLDRTGRAFVRWQDQNLFVETKIIFEGNKVVRDLLLSNGHLIPPDLLEDAGRLVEHYDRWFEEYEKVRGGQEPDIDQPFVFVGPAGYPFPSDAEKRFKERFRQIWAARYAVPEAPGTADRAPTSPPRA